jgi:O-antigen/teichoic acid export membrane protein
MIGTLYGQKYVYGPFFLTLYVIGNLFAILGSLSAGSFLSGLGKTKILMEQSILTIAIGLPLGILLIPMLGITGFLIAGNIAGLPSMFWVLYWIWKHYKARADFQSSAKILVASTIAAVIAYVPTWLLNTSNWIKLVIGLIIFLTIYVLSAPMIGAVTVTDISTLRSMFSGLGLVSRIINIPLKAAEKAAQTNKTVNKKARKKRSA